MDTLTASRPVNDVERHAINKLSRRERRGTVGWNQSMRVPASRLPRNLRCAA